MSLSTHVLDAVSGTPAVGVAVTLTDSASNVLTTAVTDGDGRVKDLADHLGPGTYRLTFDTAGYFAAARVPAFYPEVVIAFEITDPATHYHVPLLLSPYAYSTYRGS
ncbi:MULTISPECIES: hydroxyisourate hydrolase [Mycolicibacterium]|jgi:5-hydroxyisourate hydrolase|uniref:5-hydroxyisourate hydrolase n=1 Tax=Mycolicibacterium poriferae TaxID=39694 RepID=A0A6N4VA45_9MYCO|nr:MULTISPECIES: hydroxyisourate hydrolase [Mycolicibacterium]MCG7581146.1 hydroxyisourate hydrolase [Mycolicibacterium sp. OfavD-34-C]MCV7264464.1 hydroxyisourate hydrolase [Mycolicibacterium poriferae]BBX52632.1 5-hydroxyisourate hydrolase [Mycolicibacterium poriferae]